MKQSMVRIDECGPQEGAWWLLLRATAEEPDAQRVWVRWEPPARPVIWSVSWRGLWYRAEQEQGLREEIAAAIGRWADRLAAMYDSGEPAIAVVVP